MALGRSPGTVSTVLDRGEPTDRQNATNEPQEDGLAHLTRLVAVGLVALAGLEITFSPGVTHVVPFAVLLAPVWVPSLRRFTLAGTTLVLAAVAWAWGLVLSDQSAIDHTINSFARQETLGRYVTGIAGLGVIAWARTVLPLHRVLFVYGSSAVIGEVLVGNLSWKYGLALPTSVAVLTVVESRWGRWMAAGAAIALGIAGVLDDGRSFLGFCALAAVITLWQARPTTGFSGRWTPAVLLIVAASAFYLLATSLMTAGYLGDEVQERSQLQIERSGNLLVGGRPEWTATWELMRLNPSGFGPGVVPNWEEIRAARRGLHSVNVELEQNRLTYMFGEQFRLHSISADLWASFGVPGAALAAVLLTVLVRGLSFAVSERAAPAAVTLLVAYALWQLLFGPYYTHWPTVCAAIGAVLTARAAAAPSDARMPTTGR